MVLIAVLRKFLFVLYLVDWVHSEGKQLLFAFLNVCQLLEDRIFSSRSTFFPLTLLHSEQPKLYGVLAVLSAIGLRLGPSFEGLYHPGKQTRSHKSCFPVAKMTETH